MIRNCRSINSAGARYSATRRKLPPLPLSSTECDVPPHCTRAEHHSLDAIPFPVHHSAAAAPRARASNHCTLTRRAVARRSLIYCRLCTSLVVRLIVLCGIYCTNIDCIGETYCRPGPTTYCPRLKITPETLIFHDGL